MCDSGQNLLVDVHCEIKFSRYWAMPNKETFSIPPIRNLLSRYVRGVSIDPFARNSKIASITNDIDPGTTAQYHCDALEFLRMFDNDSVDVVLFDPPYSPRQVSEVYRSLGKTVNMQTTQSSFWSAVKSEIARIVSRGGNVVTCGWNSGGVGKKHGLKIVEIMLVAHGGWHNDTIVTVEEAI